MRSKVIRNIIFDWSGTLVDDLPAVWQATNYVFKRAGIRELTLEEFRAEFCLPFTKFYNRFTPHVSLAQLEIWFHERFRELEDSVAVIPHAREFLMFCQERQARTFLLSTINPDYYQAQSRRLELAHYIEQPYLRVWDKRAKIGALLQEHCLLDGETMFVGDMQHDMETARHGNVAACAVLTGYNGPAQLEQCSPDLLVNHLGELREVFDGAHPTTHGQWTLAPAVRPAPHG